MVLACTSLYCLSFFASSVTDADAVVKLLTKYNPQGPWSKASPTPPPAMSNGSLQRVKPRMKFGESESRIRVGIPRCDQLKFLGDKVSERTFESAVGGFLGRLVRISVAKCSLWQGTNYLLSKRFITRYRIDKAPGTMGYTYVKSRCLTYPQLIL